MLLSTLVGSALCVGQLGRAYGQGLNNPNAIGVRHAIVAAIEPDQNAAVTKQGDDAPSATVDILVRVLDYALDSRFYGVVDGKFPSFDPSKGAEPQEIWADRKCHQNRGFPTIWVLAVNGRITNGKTAFNVAARPRHIGALLPGDEVVTQRDPHVDLNDPNKDLVVLARTTGSGLRITLTIKSAKCLRIDN